MMMNSKILEKLRSQLLPSLSRTSPILIILFAFINCILNPSYNAFYLLIILLALFPINWIIKHLIVQPIYNLLKKETLPILGRGKRPHGATSCTFILDDIPSKSFGMPSGHSQLIWTFGTYLICKLIDKWRITTNLPDTLIQMQVLGYLWVISISILLLSIMIYVSYSRVYIESCHTIQQVIVGGILGVITGFIMYWFEPDAVNVLKNIMK